MKLDFIKNQPKYFEFIRNLRNDPEIKKGFIKQEDISKENHLSYMAKYNKHYYICLYDQDPIGYIGIVKNDLRLAVSNKYQNQGVATFMLNEITKLKNDFDVLIKVDNIKSINFFTKHSFVKKDRLIKDGINLIRMKYDTKINKT